MDRKLLNSELGRIGAQKYRELPESGIVLVLDNIRSAHNIGSAFRTSDAFKVDRIFLCGICAAPPSAEIHKSALGAEDAVPWEKVQDTLQLCPDIRERGRWSAAKRCRCGGPFCHNSAIRDQAFPQRIGQHRRRAMGIDTTGPGDQSCTRVAVQRGSGTLS